MRHPSGTRRPPPTRVPCRARLRTPSGTNVERHRTGQPSRAAPTDAGSSGTDDPFPIDRFWTRNGRAHTQSGPRASPKTAESQAKPSVGLEPTTPSLPWRVRVSRTFTDADEWARIPCKSQQSGVYGRGARKTVDVELVDGKWTEATFHACHGLPALTRVAARRQQGARAVRSSLSSATSDLERTRRHPALRTQDIAEQQSRQLPPMWVEASARTVDGMWGRLPRKARSPAS